MTYRKKLIEVALPLEEINAASAREKSIRHGHPSTLHLWWARRPLATCRAVLFSSIIDDPGEDGVPQGLLDAIDRLPLAQKYRHLAGEEPLDSDGNALAGDEAIREKKARERRYRLFTFIERLVQWENSNDPETLEIARNLILEATEGNPPPVLDPFCGGGSIPLEAQRLGLEAHASDLNPVAVLITKAMIEIPPKFADMPPVNPEARKNGLGVWKGAQGLAEDVRYYGKWMRDEAERRIGHLYPKVKVYRDPKTDRIYGQAEVDRMWEEQRTLVEREATLFPHPSALVEEELTVIAWLWARTVPSPDPAARGAHVPLVRSFVLSSKKGKEAWVEPVVDSATMTYRFEVRSAETDPNGKPQEGTISKKGGRCVLTGSPFNTKYVREQAQAGKMSQRLMAIVAEGKRGRIYISPHAGLVPSLDEPQREQAQRERRTSLSGSTPEKLTGGTCYGYGLTSWGTLFTDRQLVALTTFSDLVREAQDRVYADALSSNLTQSQAEAYSVAIATYLALGVSKLADIASTVCSWHSGAAHQKIRATFSRQALPMTWDFAEGNPFSSSSGNFFKQIALISEVLQATIPWGNAGGRSKQVDAARGNQEVSIRSTDPPYFDNIGYADLSDFFYVWLRRSLDDVYPDLFSTLLTPKTSELIATPYRHGGSREKATEFFEHGLHQAFVKMRENTLPQFPTTIYYAFKQSETEGGGDEEANHEMASTGWESMLQGLLDAGYLVNGTWPTRTELANRMIATGTNALASCIVLVCRPRSHDSHGATRREFLSALRQELRPALIKLTQGNIAPVDLAQAVIGPGMGVFSRYAAVLEADGKPMGVRTALGLINQALDQALEEQEGWYDPQTRWAVDWFKQRGFAEGPYGDAEGFSIRYSAPVPTMVEAGIVRSGGGKVKLLSRDELPTDYDPAHDRRPTIWEATQYLVRALDQDGERGAARLMRRFRETKPELEIDRARELAYRLYTICDQKRQAQEARVYNALVLSWTDIETVSQTDEASWLGGNTVATLDL